MITVKFTNMEKKVDNLYIRIKYFDLCILLLVVSNIIDSSEMWCTTRHNISHFEHIPFIIDLYWNKTSTELGKLLASLTTETIIKNKTNWTCETVIGLVDNNYVNEQVKLNMNISKSFVFRMQIKERERERQTLLTIILRKK